MTAVAIRGDADTSGGCRAGGGGLEVVMAGRVGTVWVQAGTDRLRASRINEISAGEPGRLTVRVTGHNGPVVIILEGVTDAEVTIDLMDRLLALIEQYSQPQAASVVIGFQAATDGYLPYWRVLALPVLKEIGRPPLDPAALPEVELTAQQHERLESWQRDGLAREQS